MILQLGTIARNALQAKYPSLWQGCRAAWELGLLGPTGGRAAEMVQHLDGTLTTWSTNASWVIGGAQAGLNFPGSGAYVSCPVIDIGRGNGVSAAMRFRATTSGSSTILIADRGGANPVANQLNLIYSSTGALTAYIQHTNVSWASSFSVDTWYSLVFTWQRTSNSASLYLNGKFVSSQTLAATPAVSSVSPWLIGIQNLGAGPVANPFIGAMQYARIYDRVLTPGEVILLHRHPMAMYERHKHGAGKAPATTGTGEIFRSSIFNSAIIRGAA